MPLDHPGRLPARPARTAWTTHRPDSRPPSAAPERAPAQRDRALDRFPWVPSGRARDCNRQASWASLAALTSPRLSASTASSDLHPAWHRRFAPLRRSASPPIRVEPRHANRSTVTDDRSPLVAAPTPDGHTREAPPAQARSSWCARASLSGCDQLGIDDGPRQGPASRRSSVAVAASSRPGQENSTRSLWAHVVSEVETDRAQAAWRRRGHERGSERRAGDDELTCNRRHRHRPAGGPSRPVPRLDRMGKRWIERRLRRTTSRPAHPGRRAARHRRAAGAPVRRRGRLRDPCAGVRLARGAGAPPRVAGPRRGDGCSTAPTSWPRSRELERTQDELLDAMNR